MAAQVPPEEPGPAGEPLPAGRPDLSAAPYAESPVPPAGRTRSSPPRPSGWATLRAWLDDRTPTRLRDGTLDPGRAGVRVLVAVSIFAAVVAGTFVWRARPAVVPAPAAASSASPVSPAPVSPAAVPAPSPSTQTVVVHVGGKVRDPGVFTLPAGSRVIDAVRAAGGARRGADTGQLNLARPLVDGEQVLVGVPVPPGVPPGTGTGTGADQVAPLDLNLATAEQLEQLPGVGPVLAGRIVEYRTEHGGFRSVEQLHEVSGIGPKRFADLEDRVRV